MAKYRRCVIVVDAIQWTGENLSAVQGFMQPQSPLSPVHAKGELGIRSNDQGSLEWVKVGDWIVQDGAFHRVERAAAFAMAFEPVTLELVAPGTVDARD